MGAAALAALELLGKAVDVHVEEQRADKAHERNQELMALQNKYQVEQWNRENFYNTPIKVSSRFRSAGINPRAVFGSGTATGAGIAGGLSSAPSGGSYSPMSSDKFSGLSDVLLRHRALEADIKEKESKSNLQDKETELKTLAIARERFLQENGDLFRELNEKGCKADVQQVEAFKANVDRNWYRFEKQMAFDISQAELDALGESLRKYNAEIDKLLAEKAVTEQQAENLKAENAIIRERYNTQVAVTNKEKELVNEIRKRGNVHDAEVEKLTAEIYQRWVSIGIEGAEVILRLVDIIGSVMPKKSKKEIAQTVETTVNRNSKGKVINTVEKRKSEFVE